MNALRTPVIGLVLASLVLLPGCRVLKSGGGACKKPQEYQQAEDLPALRIPVGLDAPDTRTALRIPQLQEPAVPRGQDEPCLEEPPAYSSTPARPAGG